MCDGFCSLTRVRWKFLIRNYGKRDYDFGNTVSVHVQLPERSTVASLLNAQFSKSCEKHLWHFCSIQSLSISMNHEQSHKFAFFWRSPANLLPQLFLVWFEGLTAIIAFIRRCVFSTPVYLIVRTCLKLVLAANTTWQTLTLQLCEYVATEVL